MKSYRPTTMASGAMVTSPHYLASQAGVKVLQGGGNAVDAAIAIASTLGVVYPHMNGIGGDNFWLIYNSRRQELKALNSSGRSSKNASISFYKQHGYEALPIRGYLAANTVPGAVAGWDQAYQYAAETMESSVSWPEVLADAIGYAEKGYPVSPSQEYWTTEYVKNYGESFHCGEFRKIFYKDNGDVYRQGEIFRQVDLAATLKLIATDAKQFYKGVIAEKLVAGMQQNGGVLSKEDFHTHTSDWVNPISVNYREYQAYNLPPNTQGMASLSILNILNSIDFSSVEDQSSDYYHLLVEATKLAFKDRDKWLTDPAFVEIPLDDLLSAEYGQNLARSLQPEGSLPFEDKLDPKGDTVWLGVVDQWGNAVSLIQSIYHDLGAAVVPKGTGVLMQNRGSFFSLDETAVNKLEPQKRTFHTLNPAMLFKGGKPFLVYGTMGGEGQPQTQAALVTRIIDYGYEVQQAIEAPRWLYGRTWGQESNTLKLEGRIPEYVMQELEERGHIVEKVADFTDIMGHAGMILVDPVTNVKFGGADPRGDGTAVGY